MRKIILTVISIIFVFCLSVSPFAAVAEIVSESVDTASSADTLTQDNSGQTQEVLGNFYIEVGKPGTKFEKIGATDKAELYMMEVEGCGYIFAMKNLESGAVWYSVKNDVYQKLGKAPLQYRYLFEMMNITYMGGNTNASESTTVSSISLQENKQYKLDKIENGVRFTFEFSDGTENMGFSVPMTIRVVDDHFDVSVEMNAIKTDDKCISSLVSIGVMKYLASAGYSSENYNLIPDGSGALIYNDHLNSDGSTTEYMTYIYNRDAALNVRSSLGYSNPTVLPVFGTKHGDTACFAIISSGESLSRFRAKGANRTGYSYAYNEFTYRTYDQFKAGVIWDQEKIYTKVTDKSVELDAATVSYYVLGGEDADYMGMAELYREYLLSKRSGNSKPSENVEVYLETVGGVTKSVSSYGFIVDKTFSVTTFNQAAEMIDSLAKEGIKNVNLRYKGWQPGGMGGGAITNMNIESVVGDEDSLKTLRQKVENAGGNLFMDFDIVKIDSGKMGWSIGKLSIRNVINEYAEMFPFTLNTGEPNEDAGAYYFVKPEYLQAQIDEFKEDFDAYEMGAVSVGSLGSSHYSDFNTDEEDFCDAQKTTLAISSVLAGLSTENTVMVDTGFSYTYSDADVIIGLPMYDSGANIGAVDIPFAQFVLHGVVTYTETAHNLTSLTNVQFLRELETGCMPYYLLTAEQSSVFSETNYDYIVSSQFDVWKDNLVSDYKILSSILNGYGDKPITDYRYLSSDKNVRATTYNGEMTVVVNYSENDFKLSNGQTVKAESYLTCGAGEV